MSYEKLTSEVEWVERQAQLAEGGRAVKRQTLECNYKRLMLSKRTTRLPEPVFDTECCKA